MSSIAEDKSIYLNATAAVLDRAGEREAAKLVRAAKARVEEAGYDNWNGGTTLWTVYLFVDTGLFPPVASRRMELEAVIAERFNEAARAKPGNSYTVELVPVAPTADTQPAKDDVTRSTRRAIFDLLRLKRVAWAGERDEVEFLRNVFDLSALPSTDPRFSDAEGDIWQHRIRNPDDWPEDWVYTDDRFDLMNGPHEHFLAFLAEVVHPLSRPNPTEAAALVEQLNEILSGDGWRLAPTRRIGDLYYYEPKRATLSGSRSLDRARHIAGVLDTEWMQREVERMEKAIESDPDLAIGTAKEFVESTCKSILVARKVDVSSSDDLPKLARKVARELRLVPEGIPDQTRGAEKIKQLLQNLVSFTHNLAELRGLYGTGHGRDGKHRGLTPRHARLAVGAAVTFAEFITDTHLWRETNNLVPDRE